MIMGDWNAVVGEDKEDMFVGHYVVTTRCLHISLTSSIGLTRRNHSIDYGPVPVHA